MIRFDRFGWRYEHGADWALRNVSLSIEKGEFVVITGVSGSGKSTLALAMCGLLIGRQPGEFEGTVRVAGRDVGSTPLPLVAENIGLVQQNPDAQFATSTVDDEIVFGLENRCLKKGEVLRAATKVINLLNISHLQGRSLFTLSGGEKQRVAVASMLAGKPGALVLDEPSASLDPQASRDLFRALCRISGQTGLTVIVIEHKLTHLLPLGPRVICLDQGCVTIDARGDDIGGSVAKAVARYKDSPLRCHIPTVGHKERDRVAEVSHVAVEADSGRILKDVCLEVDAGDVIAVLGPNGGGKSTLLQCLAGLVKPATGTVDIGDSVVSTSHVSCRAASVGFVFQNADHQLVADTVRREALFTANNVGMADGAVECAADHLLDQAGLGARRQDHPYRLSWGQKRRLNMISAVLHKPRLILLDEPFAGQDWENAAFLLAVIGEVIQGFSRAGNDSTVPAKRGACLVVTHDPQVVAKGCNRVLFLSGGRITLDAPLSEAFDRLIEMGHDAYVPAEWAETRLAVCGEGQRAGDPHSKC
ncbi:MAG: ABC transporter ATP-binding protein [Myxococcales bacterium]|nr:MAG: ABC transporter ATP-binding protein [Myxococcales bacterium]